MSRMPYLVFNFLAALLVFSSLGLAGCAGSGQNELISASPPWAYADLRALDPAEAAEPQFDLLAAYARTGGPRWQFRLDLLDLPPQPGFDLYLYLDTSPGGSPVQASDGLPATLAWDRLLVIPARGAIQTLGPSGPQPGMAVRVERDATLDLLTIDLDAQAAGPVCRFQVVVTAPGSPAAADTLGPAACNGAPPPRAPVLFAFWNTLPAYTPAQALRRWDGAHTGPAGGRHGLYNLLRTADRSSIPLFLLDLKTPAALSALDYLDGLPLAQSMAARGLLTLPQVVPAGLADITTPETAGWAAGRAAAESRQAGLDFGLPAAPFLFTPPAAFSSQAGEQVWFVPLPGETAQPAADPPTTALLRWREHVLLPLDYPDSATEPQASLDGPTLATRRALVAAALAAAPAGDLGQSPILALGGSLPASTWGDPQSARASFQYLAAHPWVWALTAQDLLAARPRAGWPAPPPSPSSSLDPRLAPVLDGLRQAPDNELSRAAWQSFLALTAPVYPSPPELPQLRRHYLGQVGVLQAAARWAEAPQELASCNSDLDFDGQPECLLSSKTILAVFEPESGALSYAFFREPGSVHQWIGPSSQLITGLGEPADWDLAQGLSADPLVIPGGFAGPGGPYQVQIRPGEAIFTEPVLGLTKRFNLAEGRLTVEYRHLPGALHVQLPLLLDPWQRFSPAWAGVYHKAETAGGWLWQAGPASLQMEQPTGSALDAFIDTRALALNTEDPNRELPPGHYLPFPLARAQIEAPSDFSVCLMAP